VSLLPGTGDPLIDPEEAASEVRSRPAEWVAAGRAALGDRLVAASLFACAWLVCWSGPVEYHYDSKYTLLLAENLLAGGGLQLDRHFDRAAGQETAAGTLPYQVERHGHHVYLAYPNAGAFLALPFVGALNSLGLSSLDAAVRYDPQAEIRMQRLIACPLAAGVAALLFLGFRAIAPTGLSAAAALTACLGSVVLSNLSRALWAQTWATLLVSVVCWQLLRDHRTPGSLRAPVVGSALAWLALVRPSALLIVGCVLGYVLAARREKLLRVVAWMMPWWLLAVLVNLSTYGMLRQPSHHRATELFSLEGAARRAWDVLASPSRGLVVFMPWVVLAALAPMLWRRLRARALVAMALAATLCHLAMLSLYTQWVGGACYGPRLWAETVPMLALASLSTLLAALDSPRGAARSLFPLVAIAACGWSLFVNVRGAYAPETHRWNRLIRTRELRLRYVHDWGRPQFLEGLWHVPPVRDEETPKSEAEGEAGREPGSPGD